jgi:hypothetical protein
MAAGVVRSEHGKPRDAILRCPVDDPLDFTVRRQRDQIGALAKRRHIGRERQHGRAHLRRRGSHSRHLLRKHRPDDRHCAITHSVFCNALDYLRIGAGRIARHQHHVFHANLEKRHLDRVVDAPALPLHVGIGRIERQQHRDALDVLRFVARDVARVIGVAAFRILLRHHTGRRRLARRKRTAWIRPHAAAREGGGRPHRTTGASAQRQSNKRSSGEPADPRLG